MKRLITAVTLTLSLIVIDSTSALAQSTGTYQVNITNLVPAQIFTPVLVATHNASATLFTLGMPASAELQALAEMGNVMPLTARLNADTNVLDVQNSGGLHGPGNTSGVVVTGSDTFNRVSLAAMLIPTNDAFVGLSTTLPAAGEVKVLYAYAYDAGTRSERRALCVDSRTKLPRNVTDRVAAGAPGGGEGMVLNPQRHSRRRRLLEIPRLEEPGCTHHDSEGLLASD